MKKLLIIGATLALSSTFALAQDGQATAKAAGCLNCHTVEKKKMGPALKTAAADWKKNNIDAGKATAAIKAKHPDLKASDADLKAIVGWMQTL